MTCDRARLSSYLDGELSHEEVRRLREHLADCERCTADLAAYRQVEDSVRRLDVQRAPDDLRQSLVRKIERGQTSRFRRGLSAAVLLPAIAIGLLAALVGIWRGLPAGAPPLLTSAFVVQETPESLDGLRVEFAFDRPVAPDSLVQGIQVDPPLPLIQRVQENKVELIPQAPIPVGSSFRFVVNNVRDQRGNVQSEAVAFNLVAGPTATLVQDSAADPARPNGQPVAESSGQDGSTKSNGLLPNSAAGSLPALAATNWSTAAGHSSLALIAESPEIQAALGSPIGPERAMQIDEQAFQGGAMVMWADAGQVYVLMRSTARWLSFANTWRPGDVLAPVGARPPGTVEPLRGFGKVWRDQPAVKLQLGWPVYEERRAVGRVQPCQNGVLFVSSYGVAYTVFNDGTWRSLPYPRL